MRLAWCGFALGVLWLQQQADLPDARACVAVWTAAIVSAGFATWCLKDGARRKWAGWCAVGVAAGCIGFGYAAWRAQTRLAFELPSALEGRDIELTGSIVGLPARDENSTRFLFAVDSAAQPGAHFPRLVQLSWNADDVPPPALEPGAHWRLPVRLKRPHGNANFRLRDSEAVWFARNIRATGYVSRPGGALRMTGSARGVGVAVDRWRAAIRARIDTVLADAPHRGVVVALAIGAQDAISDADWLLMRGTGTSHLVAISGLHIGFVASLAAWLAGGLWRRSCWVGRDWPLRYPAQKVATLGGACCAALHAALAGFNVPVQRALWMLGVVALAFVSGRTLARSVVLAWALGLVLLVDPWAVVSAGFWLSFGAVAAILFAMSGSVRMHEASERDGGEEPARSRFERSVAAVRAAGRGCIARVRDGVHVQWAVTIALAPLTVYWFSQIPLLGPLANAFAIPWVSVLVTPAVLAGIALPAPFDTFALRFAHQLIEVLATGLHTLSGPAWTLWQLPQPDAWALACAAVGVAWCLVPRGWPLRWAAPVAWLPLLWPAPPGPPPGAFRLTALDIGQGTSVLVETAHHVLLFDAGPGPESTHAGERIVVPYLQAHGVRMLDTLVISHADSDHAGGAPAVFGNVAVRQMVAALAPDNPLWPVARAAGAGAVRCAAGQHWQWDGVDFTMLWPDPGPLRGKPNEHCCVLRVSAARQPGGVPMDVAQLAASKANVPQPVTAHRDAQHTNPAPLSVLLTADIEAPTERTLLTRDRAALAAPVLVVPHHGSKTSSTEPFLDSIGPLIAIFQVGYRNRFHHPHPGVFERYKARQIDLARSDEDGAVRIEAVGATLSLERYRRMHRRYWMDRQARVSLPDPAD
jgi:competence protein ComEC